MSVTVNSSMPPASVRASMLAWLVPLGAGIALIAACGVAAAASKPPEQGSAVAAGAHAEPTPLIAVVSVGDQHVTIWAGDQVVTRAPVSTGMDGHRTPLGVFSVIGKERYHESNIYSGAPMPFMQRITWSGVALHAGVLPGYPASHGCIRMPESFAQKLYGMTKVGMRVIVSSHDLSPSVVANAALPTPTFVRAAQLAGLGNGSSAQARSGALLPVSMGARMQLGGPAAGDDRLLNPMERGKIEQAQVKIAALEAEADMQALLQVAAQRSDDARSAADAARRVDDAVLVTQMGLVKAQQLVADASTSDDERTRAQAAIVALETAYAVSKARSLTAHAEADAADAWAFRAAAEAKAAIAERDTLEQDARVAEHATEPLSVFVSRKEHRVFVRQGFEPVFEADVEIADQDTPIGTHVFTAVAAPADAGAMRWVGLTVPGTPPKSDTRGGSRSMKAPAPSPAVVPLPPTAANALQRVKFSEPVLQKISEKLWTGASLMISDYGVSEETGKGTDFVILTH